MRHAGRPGVDQEQADAAASPSPEVRADTTSWSACGAPITTP
jgi:hypothetical protein